MNGPVKRLKEQSRKAFAEYWDVSRQLKNAIARDDMPQVISMADTMAHLLKQAANAELAAKAIKKELKQKGV